MLGLLPCDNSANSKRTFSPKGLRPRTSTSIAARRLSSNAALSLGFACKRCLYQAAKLFRRTSGESVSVSALAPMSNGSIRKQNNVPNHLLKRVSNRLSLAGVIVAKAERDESKG